MYFLKHVKKNLTNICFAELFSIILFIQDIKENQKLKIIKGTNTTLLGSIAFWF